MLSWDLSAKNSGNSHGNAGALAGLRAHRKASSDRGDIGPNHVHADAAARDFRNLGCGGDAGIEDELVDPLRVHLRELSVAHEPAPERIVRAAREVEDLEIVMVGPMTNLALALALDPELPRRAGVTIMGGHVREAKLGDFVCPFGIDYNLCSDPEAAVMVLGAGFETRLVTADVTLQCWLRTEDIERLEVILSLTRDMGVNLAGVEIVLNMREKMERMQKQMREFVDLVQREMATHPASRDEIKHALVRVIPRPVTPNVVKKR